MLARLACLSLVLISALRAQTPVDPVALRQLIDDTVIPIHTAPADPVGGEYGTWAGARDYKVQFSASGFRFVPRLGCGAPESVSFGWRTESVRIGDHELLHRGPAGTPRTAHTDYRYEIDHGDVVEAYDVLREGVEQTFVIPFRPSASGDLTVTGKVTANLHCEPCAPGHRELQFCDHSAARVRYGRAFAIDARGETFAVTTQFDGERIVLRLEQSFVARAEFPLTIDPLTAPVTVLSQVNPESVSITVSNGANARLIIGYALWVGGGDHDAFVIATDYDYSNAVRVFNDITASWSTPQVRTAVTGSPDTWVVGLVREFSASVGRRVRAYVHPVSDDRTNSGAILLVPAPSGLQHDTVEVGGSWAADQALLTFMSRPVAGGDGSVEGVRVRASTTSLGAVFTIGAVTLIERFGPPVVTPLTEAATEWIVAVPTTDPLFQVERVKVVRVPFDGSTITTSTLKSVAATEQLFRNGTAITVAGAMGRYALVYRTTEVGTDDELTRLIRFNWPAAQPAPTPLRERLLRRTPPNALVLRTPLGSMAFDLSTQSHWAFWEGGFDIVRVGYSGNVTERVQFPPSIGGHPQFAYAALRSGSEFAVAQPYLGGLCGYHLVYPSDATSTLYGASCAPSSVVFSSDRCVAGSEFFTPTLSRIPPNTAAVYMIGFAPGHLDLSSIGMPGCFLEIDATNVLSLPATADAGGRASVTFPLRDAPLFRGDLYGQWLYVDPTAAPLPLRAFYGVKHQVR